MEKLFKNTKYYTLIPDYFRLLNIFFIFLSSKNCYHEKNKIK